MTYKTYDSDGDEVELSAEELVKRAIEDGWTITGDVAAAIRELLGWEK